MSVCRSSKGVPMLACSLSLGLQVSNLWIGESQLRGQRFGATPPCLAFQPLELRPENGFKGDLLAHQQDPGAAFCNSEYAGRLPLYTVSPGRPRPKSARFRQRGQNLEPQLVLHLAP